MEDATIKEIFETLNDQQKELLYALVGSEAARNKELEKEIRRLRKEVRGLKKFRDNIKDILQFINKEE